ncbi:MAG: hypothetical protein HFK10_09230 [Clostridia bacterium]|nr:hypothetical protein [Clostridia bacterium]
MHDFSIQCRKVLQYADDFEQGRTNGFVALPDGCYFVDDDTVFCQERPRGESRYPYSCDGRTLWACASGNVYAEESRFKIFCDTREGKEPNLAFFMGLLEKDGYVPVSLLGNARQLTEYDVRRYCIFTPFASYYVTRTRAADGVVRVAVDDRKNLCFAVQAYNKTDAPLPMYLAAYFNCLLKYGGENPEAKWFRSCAYRNGTFSFAVTENLGHGKSADHKAEIVRTAASGKACSTTSHADFCGGEHRQLCSALPLKTGRFAENKPYTTFTETAIAGDMVHGTLLPGKSQCVQYTVIVQEGNKGAAVPVATGEAVYGALPHIRFAGTERINDRALTLFMQSVFRQTEFCARAKNYAGPFIGVRDIFQQLEASLMWIPQYSRRKITEALGFIGENGRAPRQYSYPSADGVAPEMDLREFIDQGLWIITTVYEYLCFTGDASILHVPCGYYKIEGDSVGLSTQRDSVLAHLLRIADYLISNIDAKTGCLRILYGDWNDALDGLGASSDSSQKFGSGVSVMATLQLYRNLAELSEILRMTGDCEERIARFDTVRENIKNGLRQNAIVRNADGERKIVHGWGDGLSHKVASFADIDGVSRDGLTSHAFWILSGAIDWDNTLEKDILQTYSRLDSKYGLKTFEPYFSAQNKAVGRIVKLPAGTAENAATYVHATLFAIWSLYEIGAAQEAWAQIEKILPLTHKSVSATPFVMPNSYIHNSKEGLDGESMSDWFTGSGAVLTKVIIRCLFGIEPDLNGIRIMPANFMPAHEIECTLCVRNRRLHFTYRKKGAGERKFFVNGQEMCATYNAKRKCPCVYIEEGTGNVTVEVVDGE